ncbi:uncharacterized protein LOC114535652 [Dendronephthya gigantea]|uniref:uncharacterized protein LOC114535652 n=1 Tax=Dendronephthya gigantea TaxID=151771 RepID=UPI00106C7D8A|nr:uncharacterized protein LOC114535652 [Dendronephthya gigantea]
MRNVSEIVYVENLDSSELVEEHMSNKSENNDEDFDEESYTGTIDDDDLNSNTETEENSRVNELQILYNAALILRQKVQDIPKLNLRWPPLASDLTMDNVQKVVPCELFNVSAWTCGFSSEPTLSFVSDVPTTLAWDNDDFSEETRSGKGTTHITGGIIIQREQSASTELQKRDSIPRLYLSEIFNLFLDCVSCMYIIYSPSCLIQVGFLPHNFLLN